MKKALFSTYPINGSFRQAEDTDWILRLQRDDIAIKQLCEPILTRWVGHDNLCHNRDQAKEYLENTLLEHARDLLNKKRSGKKP